MSNLEAFATKIPADLKDSLDEVCKRFGLRKNYVVEMALRAKIGDILDTFDLKESMDQASGFHSWQTVKEELKLK